MNKHCTVTGLQQVDHSCPTGLHWEISPLEHCRPNLKAETHEWTSSLQPDKYEVTFTDTHIGISAKILTDVPALLTWSPQNPSPFASPPTLIYSTGPWTKDNLATALEFFFSVMPASFLLSAAILRCIVTLSRLQRFYQRALERPLPTVKCFTTAHTKCVPA